MIAVKFLYIIMPATIILSFLWAPSAEILGETSRIIYFHVPLAWLSVLAFFISGICSIIYLIDKKKCFNFMEEKSYLSASLGTFFTVLTLITGSIWAKASWGSYWNWDPRETSIIILLLVYIAYFSLYNALSNTENRGRLCASYLIIAMITVPIFVFLIPRIFPSLHPNPIINSDNRIFLENKMRITLMISLLSFTLLFFYMFNLKIRIMLLEKRIEEFNDEE